MIVLDESIQNDRMIAEIGVWYPGRVISITNLRPKTVVKDDAIAMLLQQNTQPTFVTINVDDFWLVSKASQRYCIVAIKLTQLQIRKIPAILRRILRIPEFRTKAQRMGKVIYVLPNSIEFYGVDSSLHRLPWLSEQ